MIDKLLAEKKITLREHDIYMIFEMSEAGKRYFDQMVMETFMETPKITPELVKEVAFAFQDGRRDIFREIQLVKFKVNQLAEEAQYE